ncbi:MAG: methionyl-tRNA formyltransferase [Rhizobiaceae bacterium]|nr:methionyl-tRNA formyltransferase [Rhizobiaceae bacterium]
MRVVFMGTPEFAVPTLGSIAAAGHAVVAAYTQPPRPAGRRGLEPTPSPVQREAESLGIPVLTPLSLRDAEAQAQFAALGAEVAVVVAYGLLLPAPILQAPRLGCLNGHASLLPRWRGAAPIHRAVMAGDRETGVMVMRMDEGLDTGPVGSTSRLGIAADETTGDLHDRLMMTGAALMVEALELLERGALRFVPQSSEGVSYARKIDKAETRIDWSLPAQQVHNRIRGLSPFPGAWCEFDAASGSRERLKLLRSTLADGDGQPGAVLDDGLTVACGSGAIRLTEVQRAGGKAIGAVEFVRGAKLAKGAVLA